MTWIQLISPVLLSAFTGWLVTWLLIKFLFRPRKQVMVLGFKVHGIFPANQNWLAEKIGDLVNRELISFTGLREKITDPENFNRLKPEIELHIDSFLRTRLKDTFPMLAMMIGDKTINQLKSAFMLELESLFPVIMNSYLTKMETGLQIKNMVTEKIASHPMERTEALFQQMTGKKMRMIYLAGAVIGLLTGLVYSILNALFFI